MRNTPLVRRTPLAPGGPIKRKTGLTIVRSSVRTDVSAKRPTKAQRLERQADDLFSLLVRSRGTCRAAGWSGAADYVLPKRIQDPDTGLWVSLEDIPLQASIGVDCLGPLQCCHLFSRRYQATRYDDENAWAMCFGHHLWFTNHPLAWISFTREQLGAEAYHALQQRALRGEIPDVAEVIDHLKAELARVG